MGGVTVMSYKDDLKRYGYINVWEYIPENQHSKISASIWEALDRAGIKLSQDAELSIRVYDS